MKTSFDFVVASVHYNFKMDRDAMTERILSAMDDPHVTFIRYRRKRRTSMLEFAVRS